MNHHGLLPCVSHRPFFWFRRPYRYNKNRILDNFRLTNVMRCSIRDRFAILFLIGALAVFLFAGFVLIPMLGLQYDELLFADVLLQPIYAVMHVTVGHHEIPVMLMSYLGAFKSWLFAPVFAVAGYGVASVRIPALVLGAATLVALYVLLRDICSPRAGLIAVWLLATDVTYLTTAAFDWGPVVIQNLLLVLGLLCLVQGDRKKSARLLCVAGVMFGLALWDKALFLWNLSGMIVMFLMLKLRFPLSKVVVRNALLLLLGMSIGALPLITYNVANSGATLRENSQFTAKNLGRKFQYLVFALDGQAAEVGFSEVSYPAMDSIRRPFAGLARIWNGNAPWTPSSWRALLLAVLIALGLGAAQSGPRKWILFFVGSAAIAWLQSALTVNAGQSIHHFVLIWPLLYAGAGVSADAIMGKAGQWSRLPVLALMAIFLYRGLFLIDHTYWTLIAFSPIPQFSNADAALVSYLQQSGVHRAAALDWGIANPIEVRTAGAITVLEDSYMLNERRTIADDVAECKGDSTCVFVAHPTSREMFHGVNEAANAEFARLKLEKEPLRDISDSHGTPTFVVFQLKSVP